VGTHGYPFGGQPLYRGGGEGGGCLGGVWEVFGGCLGEVYEFSRRVPGGLGHLSGELGPSMRAALRSETRKNSHFRTRKRVCSLYSNPAANLDFGTPSVTATHAPLGRALLEHIPEITINTQPN
jgi:hypothetical protein